MLGQRTLSFELREFEAKDYERLAELYNKIYPDYARSVSEWRGRDNSLDMTKYLLKRYSCLDAASGVIVGFGDLSHVSDMFHPDKYWMNVYVDPDYQRNGVGDTIYRRLVRELHDLRAVTAWTGVKEDMPEPLRFFEKRGFTEKMRVWESRLDPTEAHLERFRQYSEKVAASGITISTLAKERASNPDSLRKLHEAVMAVTADIPSPAPFTPVSYDQWEAFEINNPDLVPEGYMIAMDNDQYVGLSVVWKSEADPKTLYQGNTGVIRSYRRRGIAIAMKLRVIDFAKKKGYEKLKTWNASTNHAMLAVNIKLGFKRQVAWITLEKNLA